MFIDFHTHSTDASPDVLALVQGRETQGVHPAELTPAALDFQPSPGVWAIGECGLDKCCATPYDLQLDAFRHHIRLSETLRRPLLIHCVRAIDDVLHLRRELRPQQPWLMHGFRGKPQQADSLLTAGFYLSFGPHFNADSLRRCPLDRLLLETDDSGLPIQHIYAQVAEARLLPLHSLMEQMQHNYAALTR